MGKKTKQSLKRLNLIMAGVHAIQAGLILVLSTSFSLPVIGSYLKLNQSSGNLEPSSKVLFNLSLPVLIAVFLLISSLAHLIIGTCYNKKYNRDLRNGVNRARWIEYSLSASVMMVAISMLVGIYNIVSLSLVFILVAVMNLTGLIMELYNQKSEKTEKPNWLSFKVGSLAGIAPWLAIAFTFWLSADSGSSPPTFVYWIFVSIFLFFNCFDENVYLQYKKIGPWRNYIFGEKVYIYLSLFAKSALAWQVFIGTLRP
jgi:hypothetical protein